ncbi:maestro heat-like repeat-containing protein family member 6 [Liasis olivaceus]
MSPEELCQAVLSGLSSSSPAITLEFLGLADQLGLQTRKDVCTPLNASLAAQYRSLFHHEAAIIRWAALKQIWPLQQHWKDLEGTTTIHTLVAVLMHVDDVEEKVAEAAKDTLRHLATALRWHLGDTLLARGTYSLQELLHQIAKRLIRFRMSEGQLELEVFTCLSYFKSKQASVRRTAAMFIGHLLHQNGSLLTGGTVPIYLAYVDRLLGDQDPAVRRVAYVTKGLVDKAFSLHAPGGLVAALWRLAAGCRRPRYPPQYEGLST